MLNRKAQTKLDDFIEDEENFEQLLAEHESKSRGNSLTRGKIIKIENEEAFVDIGEKSEGILPLAEIKDSDEKLLFNVGDEIKIAIMGYSRGRALLSHKKALRKEKIEEFINNFNEAELSKIFEVKIIGKNKGGFVCVSDEGIEFFLPKSQYTFKDSNVIGKKLKVKIIKIDKDECSIVISRKKVLDEERKKKKEI